MKTLREVSDYLEIRELSLRYNVYADLADGENYADLFTPDGEVHLVGNRVYKGRDELIQVCQGTKVTAHITTDPTIELNGDVATQRSRLLSFYAAEDKSENDFVSTGWYVDDLVRTPEGWRIRRRTIHNDLELSEVLRKMRVKSVYDLMAEAVKQ